MSGQELTKLGVTWQAAANASEDGVLITEEMIRDTCLKAVKHHKKKVYNCKANREARIEVTYATQLSVRRLRNERIMSRKQWPQPR